MRIKKYANNQFIINTKDEIIFASYESVIAILKNGVLTLGNDWDYLKTTLKYLYKFLNDYFISEEIDEAMQKANKKEALQKLIDNNKIIFDKSL